MPKKPKWDETPCPECREPVSNEASRCPHCQAVYTPETIAARKQAAASAQKMTFGCLAIVLLILIATCSTGGDEPADTSSGTADLTAADSALPSPGSASLATEKAVVAFYEEVTNRMAPCDTASARVSEMAQRVSDGRATLYDAYGAAKEVNDVCGQTYESINSISVPDVLNGPAADAAGEAVESCADAALQRKLAGSVFMEVFDGDLRPSKIDEARSQAEAGASGLMVCVAKLFSTAGKAGVDTSKLPTAGT